MNEGSSAGDEPVVETAAGRVRGLWRRMPDGTASAAFRGIPFAAAPVGDLRFAAPAPAEPWTGMRDATSPGPTPQRWENPEPTLIPEPSVAGDETLNVDVFTPDPSHASSLPVLVWIHGGGFVSGSHAGPWYDGATFARDGVVLVTVSYRLGFDGFGWIDGAPQNRGVLDWIAALRWVRDNVRAFGGDPERVTIGGQSAGGGAVLTLLATPSARGLFQGAIALSPAVADLPASRARATAARLATLLGVAPDRDGFATIDERGIEQRQMAATKTPGARPWHALRAAVMDAVPYGPVIDGALLPADTVTTIADGAGSDVPLVIGATDDEFQMAADRYERVLRWVPASLALRLAGLTGARLRGYRRANGDRRGARAALGRYVTDHIFRSLVRRIARAREGAAAPTFVYRFAWGSPAFHGHAVHCVDVPFFFDVIDHDGASGERVRALTGSHPPRVLADAVHGWASAFVRTGDPGWPSWSARPGTARVFDGSAVGPTMQLDAYSEVSALG